MRTLTESEKEKKTSREIEIKERQPNFLIRNCVQFIFIRLWHLFLSNWRVCLMCRSSDVFIYLCMTKEFRSSIFVESSSSSLYIFVYIFCIYKKFVVSSENWSRIKIRRLWKIIYNLLDVVCMHSNSFRTTQFNSNILCVIERAIFF